MILAIIVLFYVAAAVLYLAINRKSPVSSAGNTLWTAPHRSSRQNMERARPAAPRPAPKQLLSPAERLLYAALKQATVDDHDVFVKIRVADLLQGNRHNQNVAAMEFRKIENDYFDFVIYSKESLTVIATIRINEQLPQQQDREHRDGLIRLACKSEKIPLLIIKKKENYDIDQLRKLISLF